LKPEEGGVPPGFGPLNPLTADHSRSSSMDLDATNSALKLNNESAEDNTDPWIVSNREEVPEEL